MAGDDSTATATVQAIQSLRCLIRDVSRLSVSGFKGGFKKDCIDLSRRVALLSHLFEEIRDSQADCRRLHTASFRRSISQLTVALQAAKRLLQFSGIISPVTERAAMEITSQFRGVRCKLEKALANFPYDDFELSEEVKKQINLVRRRYGIRTINADHHGVESKVPLKADKHPVIPDDFLCPISLQLFTDPVFVSTGQTYERSYIQQWIDHGNTTCPNTRQKLNNLTLTPNYVLRSLIAQWCTHHNVKQPRMVENIGSQTIEEQSIPIIPSQSIEEQRQYGFMIVFVFMAIYTSALILLIWLFVKK